MKYRINATCHSPDSPAEVHQRARKLGSRKVLRFLDAASLAPFQVAAAVYRLGPVAAPEDVALYTMGGWDGDMPDQPSESDGTAESDAVLGRHILEEANPVGWLRMLSNNALCQVSISEGFRGPNAHLVGGPDTVGQVLAMAATDLRRGFAGQALLVAYDTVPAQRTYPSSRAVTSAAALSLAPSDNEDALPGLLERARSVAAECDSVLDVMRACIAPAALERASW